MNKHTKWLTILALGQLAMVARLAPEKRIPCRVIQSTQGERHDEDNGGVVIDLFILQVVGWSMRADMTRDIVIDALRMAWFKRHPDKQAGLIFHSDRGSNTPVRTSETPSMTTASLRR